MPRRRLSGPYRGEETCFILEPFERIDDYYRYTCSYTWDMRFTVPQKRGKGQSFTYEVRGTLFTQKILKYMMYHDGEECWQYIHPAVKYWFEYVQDQIKEVYLDYYWDLGTAAYHNPGEGRPGIYNKESMKDENKGPILSDHLYIDYMIIQKGTEKLGQGYFGGIYFKRQAIIRWDDLIKGNFTRRYSTVEPEYQPYPREKRE